MRCCQNGQYLSIDLYSGLIIFKQNKHLENKEAEMDPWIESPQDWDQLYSCLTGPGSVSSWTNADAPATKKQASPESIDVQENEVVCSPSSQYLIQSFVGEGGFGKVAKCLDLATKETVAIKFLRNDVQDPEDIKREVSMMDVISVLDPVKSSIIKFHGCFEHIGNTCLGFEMLESCLFDFLVQRDWVPLSLSEIRPVARQLLVALDALKSIGVIHCDIKPDNVMLVSQSDEPFRVKLIDFGLAEKSSQVCTGTICQPTGYRAPEVTLGLPFNVPIDIWGAGCVLAFLYLAQNLFPVACDYQMMKSIVLLLGEPEDHDLQAGLFTKHFFEVDQRQESPVWRIMTREEFAEVNGFLAEEDTCPLLPNGLDDLKTYYPEGDAADMDDRGEFVSLLKGTLQLDPYQRLTPRQALEHDFITMAHLTEESGRSPYVEAACTAMSVCQEDTLEDITHNATSFISMQSDTTAKRLSLEFPLATFPTKMGYLQKIQRFHRSFIRYITCCLRPEVEDC